MQSIDLNADLGEGAGTDHELLRIVTSANVACGAHAGSAELMHTTVQLASRHGVVVGAHPGYPDRDGLGRREIGASPADIERWTREQIGMLRDVCRSAGVRLMYVKAHGALYNRAVRDLAAAGAFVSAAAGIDRNLTILALPGSAMLAAARAAGLPTAREAFLDRGYLADGSLAPRETPGALVSDPAAAAARAVQISLGQPIEAVDGAALHLEADSLCVHGDSPAALDMARAARESLMNAGVRLKPFAS